MVYQLLEEGVTRLNVPSEEPRGTDRTLVPVIAGLACSAVSFALVVQQGRLTGASPAANGLVTLVVCLAAAALALISMRVGRLAKRIVFLVTFIAIHIAGIGALGLTFLDVAGGDAPAFLTGALEALSGTGSTLLAFYWLRKLRAATADATALVAFSALMVSAVLVAVLGILGPAVRHLAAFALSFAQFAITRASRRHDAPGEVRPAQPGAYFGTGEARYSDRGYLATALIGVCGMALAAGVAEALTPPTAGDPLAEVLRRLVSLVCAGAAAFCALRHARSHPERPLAPELWIALGLFVGVGTVLLSLGGEAAFAGGSVATAAALLLQAMVSYLSVAFASFGARDPYVYAAVSWVALNACQVVGTDLGYLVAAAAPGNLAPAIAVMGLCALASTQVVFSQLMRDPERTVVLSDLEEGNLPERITPSTIVIAASIEQALLEADGSAGDASSEAVGAEPSASPTPVAAPTDGSNTSAAPTPAPAPAPVPAASPEVHIATSVISMGQRFGLTGREIEVLTLYALGHTQARVSEELHLSQNTVHTHIKRIYDKTNLHSRQEILDYLAEYEG